MFRAARIASTAVCPAFATAPRPNRTTSPTGVKLAIEELTSGGRTSIPEFRTSLTYAARSSFLEPIWLER